MTCPLYSCAIDERAFRMHIPSCLHFSVQDLFSLLIALCDVSLAITPFHIVALMLQVTTPYFVNITYFDHTNLHTI